MSCLHSRLLVLSMVFFSLFLAVPVVLAQTVDHAPNTVQTRENLEQLYHEAPSELPMTPAAADPTARSPRGLVQRGPYVSVQVNVDGAGQNIVGDAANEPSITVNPLDPNQVAIGWRQFDSISSDFRQAGWSYTQDGGNTWTFPGVLTPGTFRSDPVLDFDADGNFYYFSLKSTFLCDMFISANGGVSWQGPFAAYGGDKNWMTVDRTPGIGRGNIYCTWTGSNNFTRSTDGGFNYMSPIPSLASWNTLTVGPTGNAIVCGWNTGSSFYVQSSANAQNPGVTPSWNISTTVNLGGSVSYFGGPNPGGLLGQTWIASNHSSGPHGGEIYLLSSVDPSGSDPLDVHFCRSTNGGSTWSAPVKVNSDKAGYQWFGTMSVAPNGRIDVVWNSTHKSGQTNICELYYSYSHDGGQTWADNIQVNTAWNSHLGWPQQNKIGDYYDMVSHDDFAHLAYSATLNGEQDVYYVKLFPDLNFSADNYSISIRSGDTVNFSLDAGAAHGDRTYLIVGSMSGSEPGIPLPGGSTTLPVHWDGFTDYLLTRLNTPLFNNFLASLDSNGHATAQISAPALSPSKIGKVMTFAYCLEGSPDWDFASIPLHVEFVP